MNWRFSILLDRLRRCFPRRLSSAPRLAAASATSLPSTPACPGTQLICQVSMEDRSMRLMAAHTALLISVLLTHPLVRQPMAYWLSVMM